MTSLRQTSLFFTGLLALANAQNNLRALQEDPDPTSFMNAVGDSDGAVGRVIGGSSVQPGALPFYGHFEGEVMCGGFLAAEDVFVTAAHCLEKGFPGRIRIGATQTVSNNEGQEVSVCSAIIHPANNMKSMENDIAILKLCDPVFITSYGEYNRNPNYPGNTGVDIFMIGFGRTNVNGGLSPLLQKAKADYLDNDTCAARYDKYNGDQTFCADAPTAGICYGDSGGPTLDSSNMVVGLNSYIVDTCASSYPDFFTRISSYSSWLDEIICTQAQTAPEWCSTSVSGGGGTGTQGNDDEDEDEDDDEGGFDTDLISECLTLFLGFFQSLLGGRR